MQPTKFFVCTSTHRRDDVVGKRFWETGEDELGQLDFTLALHRSDSTVRFCRSEKEDVARSERRQRGDAASWISLPSESTNANRPISISVCLFVERSLKDVADPEAYNGLAL